MKINIGMHEYSIIWDGVYYHALSNYPNISDWELKSIIQFVEYENKNDREVEIICNDDQIVNKINHALLNRNDYLNVTKPEKITECTACKQKGCLTDFLCHTASLENATSIIRGGSILSAVKARNISAEQLQLEGRNAAKDPSDYFEHLMLSWGNCQAGDRLVMERKLEREPNEQDLSQDFEPGVRFYFKYDKLVEHQNATFDGYHPLKIKDELKLKGNLFAIIIPKKNKEMFENIITNDIKEKIYYIDNYCKVIF